MCNYCNAKFYIKVTKCAKSFSAPVTRIGALRQKLEDLTGEMYVEIPNQYCPMCGSKMVVKEVGGMNVD